MRQLWSKWKDARHAYQSLDRLLIVPDHSSDLAERNRWLVELAYWLRRSERSDVDILSLIHI